jgi:hypothetical protein
MTQVTFEGDHGLVVTMDFELYKKCEIKKEGNRYVIVIPTELWEEAIE